MASDFWIVLQWWGTLFLVGAVAYPLTNGIFGGIREIGDIREIGEIGESKEGGRATPKLAASASEGWWDQGYLFSKAVGMAVVTWIVFVMGTIHLLPFSLVSIVLSMTALFLLGLLFNIKDQRSKIKKTDEKSNIKDGFRLKAVMTILIEELFFLVALLFWSWIKGHEPSIRGLEKFMDYGFMQSILNSQFFPPADMWYAGFPINYYYFGHMVTAVLTRLSGLDLAVTFNLMLATLFALTLTMSFSIGCQLSQMSLMGHMRRMKNIAAGWLTAFLVTLAGNMQTIYAFTRGYTGENVKPFWELGWGMRDIGEIVGIRGIGDIWGTVGALWGKLGEGMRTYWYPNATRFIPLTIHEFPSYSFVVSDVHGHVLSIPFVLLAIGLLISMFIRGDTGDKENKGDWGRVIFYGFLVGVLIMTNALDGPIYLGLFAIILGISNIQYPISKWKKTGSILALVLGVAALTSLPFLVHFKSFVTGVAVNCPLPFLANMKFGPLLFEGVEKCQRSPLWMWWLLWGFFVFCGVGLIISKINDKRFKMKDTDQKLNIFKTLNLEISQIEKLLLTFFVFALVLIVVPEFIYFKDIYPAHFRSNTMFKLGYEAFILFSIVAGYTIINFLHSVRKDPEQNIKYQISKIKYTFQISKMWTIVFVMFLIPQLILVSIYPIFSVRSYFNSLRRYDGIDGLGWLRREYPADYSAIEWLNSQNAKCQMLNAKCDRYAIVEADGDSYTDYARFSAFTGRPTVIGWAVHEWLWRGTYDAVAPRREDVRQIYESEDLELTNALLAKYRVRYIIVGKIEREKYKSLQEWKFAQNHSDDGFGELGREVFRSGGTVIYLIEEPIDKEV